jgi:hypothetical protein
MLNKICGVTVSIIAQTYVKSTPNEYPMLYKFVYTHYEVSEQ